MLPHGAWPCRLPPSENGEWWEISDESRGGIPYYYHTKTGETVWEKPEGFVIPLTVLQVRTLLGSLHSDSKLSPIRILPSVAASQSHFLQPPIRARPHVQLDKSNLSLLTVHVHIPKRPEPLFNLPVGCTPPQVAPLPPRRRAQRLPLCDVTLLPIPITQHRRD
jgi:WW domain